MSSTPVKPGGAQLRLELSLGMARGLGEKKRKSRVDFAKVFIRFLE